MIDCDVIIRNSADVTRKQETRASPNRLSKITGQVNRKDQKLVILGQMGVCPRIHSKTTEKCFKTIAKTMST